MARVFLVAQSGTLLPSSRSVGVKRTEHRPAVSSSTATYGGTDGAAMTLAMTLAMCSRTMAESDEEVPRRLSWRRQR